MNGRFNKILGCILFVAFVILLSSNLVEIIYSSINDTSKRGHTVEIETASPQQGNEKKEFSYPAWEIPKLLQVSSKENGENIFNTKCKTCHNLVGDKNMVGPNLNKVIGRLIGSKTDFSYSKILLSYNSQGEKWDQENFFKYIYATKKFAPGGRMAFVGIKKEAEIADLFSYISSVN